MSGMKRFGHKTKRVAKPTLNESAIALSKQFLLKLAGDRFFAGDELSLSPALKNELEGQFSIFIMKNRSTQSAGVWSLFVEHITEFTEEAFRLKRCKNEMSWSDASALVERYTWRVL